MYSQQLFQPYLSLCVILIIFDLTIYNDLDPIQVIVYLLNMLKRWQLKDISLFVIQMC